MEDILKNYIDLSSESDNPFLNLKIDKRPIKKYYETSIDSIRLMERTRTKSINLFLSGGLDSAFVFKMLCELQIDFRPVIVQITDRKSTRLNSSH